MWLLSASNSSAINVHLIISIHLKISVHLVNVYLKLIQRFHWFNYRYVLRNDRVLIWHFCCNGNEEGGKSGRWNGLSNVVVIAAVMSLFSWNDIIIFKSSNPLLPFDIFNWPPIFSANFCRTPILYLFTAIYKHIYVYTIYSIINHYSLWSCLWR